jgi:hypothetical protein
VFAVKRLAYALHRCSQRAIFLSVSDWMTVFSLGERFTYVWIEPTATGIKLATSKQGMIRNEGVFKFTFCQGMFPIWMAARAIFSY